MKKFTKGCLMTALVLFIVGFVVCMVCGLLGGFRQLEEMDGLGWIPFRYSRNAIGGVEFGFLGHEVEILGDIDDIGDIGGIGNIDEKKQLPLTADTLGDIDIDVEHCNVRILRSEDEYVWLLVGVEGDFHDMELPRYTIENDGAKSDLCIENEVKHPINHWMDGSNDMTLYLWLPDGCALEECEIDVGAGVMDSIFLKARQVDVSLGAGSLKAAGFEGDEVNLEVEAGELLAGRVTAGKADFEVGAGTLNIEELLVSREADISVSAGNCGITGTITGELELKCDVGSAQMHLTGSEDDHSYEVRGMGEITVGSYRHDGFAAERSWNAGKGSLFDIDCNLGTVTVTFEE